TGVHPEQIRPVLAGRVLADRRIVVDGDRVFRVEADDAVVLDVNTRHAVAGRGQKEAIVETEFERARLDVTIPVEFWAAEPEVPFADDAGGVTGALQHIG